MTESWQVRPATPGQLSSLTRTLSRAFVTEPMMTWPIGALSDPTAAIEASFAIWDAANIELGVVFEAGQGAGVAVWVAPELAGRWIELERQARPAIYQLSDDGGHRYNRMWEWVEAREPAEPAWYLDRVGVDTERRGEGLGKALVTFGLANAGRDGLPAYLETATERNVAYYVSLGFRVVDEGDAPDGGPHIWFLRWDPPAA